MSGSGKHSCARCGAELAAFAMDGLCSACLLERGLEDDSAFPVLSRFGDYELIEEIARGGMGVVYKARQLSLERIVAVKLLLFGPMANADTIRRFRVEAVAAGSLQHPNIVAIHEVGIHNDQHFLVMDYVDGPNLAKFVHGQSLPPKRAAAYVKTIADAVHYAHERGILHRDLKPSNVLIDSHDQPRVTDFGLARRLDGDSSLTLTGQVIGSPNYMPPEQAVGCRKRGAVSRRSDVYGLGAILYQLLTGRPPFQGESITDTLHQVLNVEPISPRMLNPSVPLDLQTICLKCLQKEPGHRYGTAKEFAVEIQRFVNDEPILSRPVSRPERVWRWCRRKPALTAALTFAVLAMAGSTLFGFQAHRAEQRRLVERRQSAIDKATVTAWSGDLEATESAIREAELAGASVGQTRLLRGQVAFQCGEYNEAVRHLEQAVRLLPGSVAARSMLLIAYNRTGDWKQAEPTFQSLIGLRPKTPEDYVFRGLAEAEEDPARGLATLDKGLRRGKSSIGWLMRARVRMQHAMLTGYAADAEGAISDAKVAKQLLPGNLTATTTSLYSYLAAAAAYAEAGQLVKRETAMQQAAIDAAKLKEFPRNQHAVVARIQYLRQSGDDRTALDELLHAIGNVQNPFIDYLSALALYMRGQFPEALKVMARTATGKEDPAYFYILAELPDGPQRALKEFRQVWESSPSSAILIVSQTTLRLLGQKVEATEACQKLRQNLQRQQKNGWVWSLLDYQCEQLTTDELLKKAGSSKWRACEAHFHIGMTCLGEGDRRGAREHFQAAAATGAFVKFEHNWSCAFLARMDKDPNWPQWIPAKDER